MMTLSQLTELLGWASVINMGVLVVAAILLVVMKPLIASIHSKMFGIPENDLPAAYFNYLANYKLLVFIFILAPYFSLKIMGQ